MHRIIPIVFLCFLLSVPIHAQGTGKTFEVGQLEIEGNNTLTSDQILNVMRTRETPWSLWKWIYGVFNAEILGGQKPEYYDPIVFASDYYQVKRCYEDYGFFHSKIDTSILVDFGREKVFLTMRIMEGRRSLIDTIHYRGFDHLPHEVLLELVSNKLIQVGDPYVQENIELELRRLVEVFANNGYVNVKVLSVEAIHFASTDNFSLQYSFNPGKQFTFDTISIDQDTASEYQLDPKIVLRHLDFQSGEVYSEQKKIESERNLNRLGIFEATKIENALPDSGSSSSSIPVRVFVRTRPFQELTPEIGVNDENNAFNVMAGIGYSHRNIFGGAQNLSTHLRLNLQPTQLQSLFNGNALQDSSLIYKAELTTQLIQPYFINNKTSLSAAFSAMIDKQTTYYIPSISFRLGTQSQTATYTRLFIDWNLQLSDPKTVATRKDTTISTEFTKQFNSFITVTLQRDKRNDIFYPSKGIFQSISLEEGGFFPRSFGKMLGLNLPYSQYVKFVLNGQWYWDPGKKETFIWASRWRTGAAILYGDSPQKFIPLTQRFFSGGSGSVRGWKARNLGAMPEEMRNKGGNAMFEGTIEARWNLLKGAGSLWFIDFEKFSTVFFYDCGNIWTEPKKMRISEIAMAFGFGIRYNTVAGPIRIDFGMKLYDPDAPGERQWVTQKRFFPETFKGGVIHLGVGHTF